MLRTKFDALLAKKEQSTFTFYFLLHILLTGWIGHCSVLYYCSIIGYLYWNFLRIGPLFCPQLPRRFDNFCGAGRGPPSPHSARRTPPPRIEVSPWAGASIPGRLLIIGCQSWISPFYLLQFFFFFLSHPFTGKSFFFQDEK